MCTQKCVNTSSYNKKKKKNRVRPVFGISEPYKPKNFFFGKFSVGILVPVSGFWHFWLRYGRLKVLPPQAASQAIVSVPCAKVGGFMFVQGESVVVVSVRGHF